LLKLKTITKPQRISNLFSEIFRDSYLKVSSEFTHLLITITRLGLIIKTDKHKSGMVAHACNLSYLGGLQFKASLGKKVRLPSQLVAGCGGMHLWSQACGKHN
jgi:hypothetical protein